MTLCSYLRALVPASLQRNVPHSLLSWRALLFAAGLSMMPAAGVAMTVAPPTFDELVAESEQIVRVEVLGTEARLEQGNGNSVIHTFVRCRVLRSLKGDAVSDELTLRFQGGQVGDLQMVVPGMPRYQTGERCVLFVQQNGRAFCPLVAVKHGSYRIAATGADGRERVLRDNRDPLMSTAQVARPLHDGSTEYVLQLQPERALELASFETMIVGKVQEQSRNARLR